MASIYIWKLIAGGLEWSYIHSSNVFELTLIFMQIDAIEGLHVALYEVSPCKSNGILLVKVYCIFYTFYVYLSEGKAYYTLGVTF